MEGYTPPPEVDISHIEVFKNLKHLSLRQTDMCGRYPYIFEFEHLRTLDLLWCRMEWSLEMLSGLPRLEKLYCPNNLNLTGDIRDARVLIQTLKELTICGCEQVTGTLQDLYDFPLLEKLDVDRTQVTGDIRTIGPNDFKELKSLGIGEGVYGGGSLKTISEAPSVMQAKYELMKRMPGAFQQRRWHLDRDAPEWYEGHGHHSRAPPFWVEFVHVGPRMGWRWTNCVTGGNCAVHWLDPEPSDTDDGYEEYQRQLQYETRVGPFFQGWRKPPTLEEYTARGRQVPLDPMLAQYSAARQHGWW